MDEQPKSKYWLDQVVEAVMQAHPTGKIVVSSGHSPSGYYHIGTIRETLTASLIADALARAGREVEHLDVVDDLDVFRKVPAGVDASFEKYLGTPLAMVPSPDGEGTYADYFLAPLYEALEQLGVRPTIKRAHEFYPAGLMTTRIEQALDQLDNVKEILREVGGRELAADWVPVQLLSDNNSLREWQFTGWDKTKQVIFWRDEAGKSGELDYTKGRVKLDWRLDWPARWAEFGVAVEPFGRDHAAGGGSYDTGKVLVKDIFGGKAPFPVPYEFIMPAGESKKFSKSTGGVITPAEALDVMPAEILRYFIAKPLPAKTLYFDTGLGLFNLIDEFSKVESIVRSGQISEFGGAYEAATAGKTDQTIASVPFNHLVAVYQAARGEAAEVMKMLERTGFADAVRSESDVLARELKFVANWLAKYAPDTVKFEVQEQLPAVELSDKQRQFLGDLAERLQLAAELDGPAMHEQIYAAKEAAGLVPSEAFQALYRVILGKDHGPKAGWFLANLDREWLIQRLRLAH